MPGTEGTHLSESVAGTTRLLFQLDQLDATALTRETLVGAAVIEGKAWDPKSDAVSMRRRTAECSCRLFEPRSG